MISNRQNAFGLERASKAGIKNYFIDHSKFVSREEFEKELALKDFNWISAKLGSLYICYYVSINTGPKANRFITKIVNYAGSKSEDSSAYIKVYE